MSQRILICCGAGGVGKTTTSAALALQLALDGYKVGVITIDPARRLADALGLQDLTNAPQTVSLAQIDADCTGRLDAMMLDMKATFDSIISRHAPDAEVEEKLLHSRYYRFVSEKLAGSHEYMAMERLYQLHTDSDYDIIVVDTPPAQNAMDFLRAPQRLASVMSEAVVKWMSLPKDRVGFRILERGSHTVMAVLKKLAGQETVTEIAEFFSLISELAEGFRERSLEMMELLKSDTANFVLIGSASPASRAESIRFLAMLKDHELPYGGAIVNRVHAYPQHANALDDSAFPDRPAEVDQSTWKDLCSGVAKLPPLQQRLADGDAQYCQAIASDAPTWTVPRLSIDIHDLHSLAQVSNHLQAAAQDLASPNLSSAAD